MKTAQSDPQLDRPGPSSSPAIFTTQPLNYPSYPTTPSGPLPSRGDPPGRRRSSDDYLGNGVARRGSASREEWDRQAGSAPLGGDAPLPSGIEGGTTVFTYLGGGGGGTGADAYRPSTPADGPYPPSFIPIPFASPRMRSPSYAQTQTQSYPSNLNSYRPSHSQSFDARTYHPQPHPGHLHSSYLPYHAPFAEQHHGPPITQYSPFAHPPTQFYDASPQQDQSSLLFHSNASPSAYVPHASSYQDYPPPQNYHDDSGRIKFPSASTASSHAPNLGLYPRPPILIEEGEGSASTGGLGKEQTVETEVEAVWGEVGKWQDVPFRH